MKQTFTVLGSGSAVPQLQRIAAANLLQIAGSSILIDIGQGALRRIMELGCNPHRINRLCLTHFHPDHCSDLVALVWGRYNDPQYTWQEPLHVLGGPGLQSWWNGLCQVWPGLSKPYDKGLLILQEITAGATCAMDFWQVATLSVKHKPESLAYRFEYDGRSVVISGDTGPVPELSAFARKTNLLVLECAGGLKPVAGHLNITQAAAIADRAAPEKLLLTHFYPEDDVDLIQAEFSLIYQRPFAMAFDLMQMEV